MIANYPIRVGILEQEGIARALFLGESGLFLNIWVGSGNPSPSIDAFRDFYASSAGVPFANTFPLTAPDTPTIVDWGDGSPLETNLDRLSGYIFQYHTYPNTGEYTVQLAPDDSIYTPFGVGLGAGWGTPSGVGLKLGDEQGMAWNIISVSGTGNIFPGKSMSGFLKPAFDAGGFMGLPDSITTGIGPLETRGVEDFSGAFQRCGSLTSYYNNADRSPGHMDLQSGINFTATWSTCTSLPHMNHEVLHMPRAENLSSTFASCSNLTGVGGINAPLATNIASLFGLCAELVSVGQLNLPSAKTGTFAFYQTANLMEVPDLGAELTDVEYAFYNAGYYYKSGQLPGEYHFRQTGFSGVKSFPYTFYAMGLTGTGMPFIDTSSATGMFNSFGSLDQLYPHSFPRIDTSNCTNLEYTFKNIGVYAYTATANDPLSDSLWTGAFPFIDTSSCTNLKGTWQQSRYFTFHPISTYGPNGILWQEGVNTGSPNGDDLLDTSSCTAMDSTWMGCENFQTSGGATGAFPVIDFSNVEHAQNTWLQCKSLTGVFPSLDTSSLKTGLMSWAGCTGLSGFSHMDFSNMITGGGLFQGLTQPQTANSNFYPSSWDFTKVEYAYQLFASNTYLTALPSSWTFPELVNASSMFEGCSGLKRITSANFGTSKISWLAGFAKDCGVEYVEPIGVNPGANMAGAFETIDSFGQNSRLSMDISTLLSNTTSAPRRLYKAFKRATGLYGSAVLDLQHMDENGLDWQGGAGAYPMLQAFLKCTGLTSISLSNTTGIRGWNSAFDNCQNVTSISLGGLSGTQDMSSTFSNCTSLTSAPDLSTMTWVPYYPYYVGLNLSNAFFNCHSLTTLPVLPSPFGGYNANLEGAFNNCYGFTSIPALNFGETSRMSELFEGCSSVTSVGDLTFNARNQYYMVGCDSIFRHCQKITSFGAWNNSSGINRIDHGFEYCSSLVTFPFINLDNISASKGFENTWHYCTGLQNFPANMFDNIQAATQFNNAFLNCFLTATSIENILVSIDANGLSNGTLNMHNTIGSETSAAIGSWSAAAVTAKNNLVSKGWTVTNNT